MTIFTKVGAAIASPVDDAGNPRRVANQDMQVWMTEVERAALARAVGAVTFGTKAEADAALTYDAWTTAWIIADPIVANNGWYTKFGASGSGSWVRKGDLPYSYIKATNAGAGTANAIVATTATPIPAADGGALIVLPIAADTTASPVTVAFNGDDPLTIKTNSGADIAEGGLTAGMIVAGYTADSGTTFRLLSDQASAALLAEMEGLLADFRTRFLGSFSTDDEPTTDLSGNPLTEGAIYWNSTESHLRIWDGATWQPITIPTVASQAEAESGSNNAKMMTPLRVLQQGKARGFFSLQDFATTVIDNGENNALTAFQSAVSSGEKTGVRPTSDSYKLDGAVFIDNPVTLIGDMERSKIKRVGDTHGFVIRYDGVTFDGFYFDGWGLTATCYDFLFGTSIRGASHCNFRNIRGNGSRGVASDENYFATAPATHSIYDTVFSNVHYTGHRGPGYLIRDADSGFLRLHDTEIGLITDGGADAKAYSFANVAGLFMRRVEATGSHGYEGTTTAQRLLEVTNGAAFYFDDVFMDNAGGEGVYISGMQHVMGGKLQGSICNLEAVKIANTSIVQISTIRGEGRNATSDATGANNAVHINDDVSNIMIGSIRGHNASQHGVYNGALRGSIGAVQTHGNAGYGYVGDVGRAICGDLHSWSNTTGAYFLGNSGNVIDRYQAEDGTFTKDIVGPASV